MAPIQNKPFHSSGQRPQQGSRPPQGARPGQSWGFSSWNRPTQGARPQGSTSAQGDRPQATSRPQSGSRQQWQWRNEQRMVYINDMIKAPKVLLVDESGEKAWVLSRDEALRRAASQGLDLVQVAYNPIDMICTAKIVDYGKYMYDKQKDEREKKKTQKAKWNKEVKLSYTIGENDLALKVKKAEEFLEDWYAVRFSVRLKWRERIFADKVIERLKGIEQTLELIWKSQGVKQEANWISLFLLPKVK